MEPEHPLGLQRGGAAAPLPYLPPCTGRSIAACRSCPRTPWARSSGCSRERQGLRSGEEREGHSEHLRERNQPTEHFKVEQGTKKECLPPPHLSDKTSQPTVLHFVQSSVGDLGDTRSHPSLLQDHNPPKVWVPQPTQGLGYLNLAAINGNTFIITTTSLVKSGTG